MRTALTLAISSALLACGGQDNATSFAGMTQPGISTAPAASEPSTTDSSSSTTAVGISSTTAESTSTSSTDADTVWDMGAPDFGPLQPAGCEGKIDFLFVISTESTMKPFQERLIASFPGFIDAIQQQIPDFDVHIVSANTNAIIGLDDCGDCTDSCDPQGQLPLCGGTFTACDKKVGAGVTFPTGEYASNRRCSLDSGVRYITSGQKNLDDAFACIAQVGVGGSGITGEAMVAALQPNINSPDDEFACNGSFLREDALLVVTLIQDGYDQDSLGTVDEWIEALRIAKHDDDDAFAVLVLTTDVDLGFDQLCLPEESNPNPNRLRTLADGIEHGFVGSVCAPSYDDFFADHVAVLVDLCDDFVPPG